jgi:hypothetical protein
MLHTQASVHMLHVVVNSSRERRKARTAHRRSLRTRLVRQDATRDAPSRDAIRHVVLCSILDIVSILVYSSSVEYTYALDGTLGPAEQGTDHGKVLGTAVTSLSHVLEADSYLLSC